MTNMNKDLSNSNLESISSSNENNSQPTYNSTNVNNTDDEDTKYNVASHAYDNYTQERTSKDKPRTHKGISNLTKTIAKLYEKDNNLIMPDECPKHNCHLVYFINASDGDGKACPICLAKPVSYMASVMKNALDIAFKKQQMNKAEAKKASQESKDTKLTKAPNSVVDNQKEADKFYIHTMKNKIEKPVVDAKNQLMTNSIFDSKSTANNSFDNFNVETKAQDKVKYDSEALADYYTKTAYPCNIIMPGGSGAGKSHLAMSVLKYVNNTLAGKKRLITGQNLHSNPYCLFINVNTLMDKIRNTFNQKDGDETEQTILNKIGNAYLIVLDDFGTELNRNDVNNNGDMPFTQKVIYRILDSRVRTIFTTNFGLKQIFSQYDQRITSRIASHLHIMSFANISDYRRYHNIPSNPDKKNLPF